MRIRSGVTYTSDNSSLYIVIHKVYHRSVGKYTKVKASLFSKQGKHWYETKGYKLIDKQITHWKEHS